MKLSCSYMALSWAGLVALHEDSCSVLLIMSGPSLTANVRCVLSLAGMLASG